MGEDSGEKTEEPTPHKLREARKKGQIAKSKEFTSAILLFVSFYGLKWFAGSIWKNLSQLSDTVMLLISTPFSFGVASVAIKMGFEAFFKSLLPLFMLIYVVGMLVEALQTQFLFSMESLQPKLENLNPINGFKKFFSLKQYVELVKSVIKMAVVVGIIWWTLKEQFFIVPQSQLRNPWLVMAFVGNLVMTIIIRIGILYFFIAFLDYVYQRYEFLKQMRMTKKEVKEEYKRLEGDPMVKQRQREAQRAMAQGRQMGAVPGADVVVTNPIHLALAIHYDEERKRAPLIVAKGKRLIAEEIKRIAELSEVPIVENPPLAQALFKSTEVGQEVPPDQYQVVAEILAFVYHLKKKKHKA